jgi:hypothetical protein
MSKSSILQRILSAAKEKERNHDWIEAAKSYEQALQHESITASFAAETQERLGFCYNRASTQTRNLEDCPKISFTSTLLDKKIYQ